MLLVFLTICCNAQGIYSRQNLEQSNSEELNQYLDKANKIKKAGTNLLIAGPVTSASGYLLASLAASGKGGSGMFGLGFIMMLSGPVCMLVGLPLLIAGTTRYNRIMDIKNSGFSKVEFHFAPERIYNFASKNYLPGMSFTICF